MPLEVRQYWEVYDSETELGLQIPQSACRTVNVYSTGGTEKAGNLAEDVSCISLGCHLREF